MSVLSRCINDCHNQSCLDKSVKKMLLLEKHKLYHFSDENHLKKNTPNTFSAQNIHKKVLKLSNQNVVHTYNKIYNCLKKLKRKKMKKILL